MYVVLYSAALLNGSKRAVSQHHEKALDWICILIDIFVVSTLGEVTAELSVNN